MISVVAKEWGSFWKVGCPINWIVSECAVTRPRSAAALQNSHFRNGAGGSDASQNGSYSGLVTPRLHKM
jgi:hypothetical protein